MIIDPELGLPPEELAAIFAMSLFPLLKVGEGVAVHKDGKGFIVHRTDDQVVITHDDDMLNFKDRQLLWLHDEPVGNA